MENGATVFLESAWALNTLDVREAVTTVCGTKAGGDMQDGVRINGIRQGRQYVLKPNLNAGGVAFYDGDGRQYVLRPSFEAGGVAFNDGAKGESAADREERLWIEAVRDDTEALTKPEQAFCVTRILEGIYPPAKTGPVYTF